MLIALFATTLLAQDINPAGRYQVVSLGQTQTCTIRLQNSLPGLPEAFVDGDAQSGFAFATPGCPLGLDALSLWRYATETGTLTLVDGAGEILLTATRVDRNWQAQSPDGMTLRLTRD